MFLYGLSEQHAVGETAEGSARKQSESITPARGTEKRKRKRKVVSRFETSKLTALGLPGAVRSSYVFSLRLVLLRVSKMSIIKRRATVAEANCRQISNLLFPSNFP